MLIFIKTFTVYALLCYGISLLGEDKALNLADNLFDSGYYGDAITEYKRFIFFNPSNKDVSYAYYKVGLAYRNGKQWNKSFMALRNSIRAAPGDSIKNERQIALAVTLIANGNYNVAKFQLLRVASFTKFSDIKRRASFFLAVAYLYMFQWEPARDAFQLCFEGNEDSRIASAVDSLLLNAQNSDYKSPSLARRLSAFLPGAGQIYAGDLRNGLNALALNGALGYSIVYKILNHDYGNAYIIYSLLFKRYYFGNRYHAQRISREYNRHLNETCAESILELFMSEEE
ncbi:outer membrane protein assembly factor BamD [candidate division WOR-3 bacterium]|nr:outer membrane protein assembly factor BamD [candidate division WOR-3 bacterium]